MLQARRLLGPLLSRRIYVAQQLGICSTAPSTAGKGSEEAYELLPPGCSLVDPTYGEDSSDTRVHFYDGTHEAGDASGGKVLKEGMPANRAAAEKRLAEKKEAQLKQEAEDDEPYVYLPPGSSMREPLYHNSMSDPQEQKTVYVRDPSPQLRK